MDAERMARLDRALDQALETGAIDPAIDDPADRRLLRHLLDSANAELPGLDQSPIQHESLGTGLSASLAVSDNLEPGSTVGAFRLIRLIGSGGMGVVFLAERSQGGFDQQVALKVLAGRRTDTTGFQLFQRERELLSQLEHPGIARLIDGGITDSWRPWFAMEYVDGLPIHEYAARHQLSVDQRVMLFLQACDALDYAHRQLVLHRDIKPANLLVDREGKVRLVDFGLGRALVPDQATDGSQTIAVGRLTPDYASPEQARGEAVTVSSEVYQLGLVLYRLLCGQLPYRSDGSSAFALAQSISSAVIARPSEAWLKGRQVEPQTQQFATAPRRLARQLRGDLDNIVLTALAREPDQRYRSVEALAADLRRHRKTLPVQARAATRRYRLERFIRRHAIGVSAVIALAIVLVTSMITLALQADQLALERDRAIDSAARNERLIESMSNMIRLADADRSAEQLMTLGERLEQYLAHVRDELTDDPKVRLRMLAIIGEAMQKVRYWDRAADVLAEARALSLEQRGAAHPGTHQLSLKLAESRAFSGDFERAEDLLADLLDQLEREASPPVQRTADTYYLRGYLRTYHLPEPDPRWQQGIEDLQRALAGYRELHVPPHADIAQAMHALGIKHPDRSQRLDLTRAALAMTIELYGENHVTSAARMAELALVHDHLGQFEQAADIARQAWEIHAAVRGETHPGSLTILNNLAGSLREAGDLDQAVELYRELHILRRQTLPEDHLLLAYTAHGLGNTLRELDRLDESEHWLREALRLCLLHESGNQALTRVNLSKTLEADGRIEQAAAEQQRAVKAFLGFHGSESASVQAAKARLEKLLSRMP